MLIHDPDRERPLRRRTDRTGEAEPLRVLAVDDDPFYLKYIAHLLSRLGFQTRGVTSAEEALLMLESDEYDLLLMDFKMPGMNGMEAIQRLRAIGKMKHIYSILLTAHEVFSTRIRALESGFDDFILKTSSEIEVMAKLRSATRLILAQRHLRSENKQLYHMAFTDPLTGIPNRRHFFDHAADLLDGRTRLLTVVLYDLDGFKRINDEHGHITGDRILSDVGEVFRRYTRYGDLVARYGGDEFVTLINGLSDSEARRVADRISRLIAQLQWTVNTETFGITASYGVTSSDQFANPTIEGLLAAADQELYRTKRQRTKERLRIRAVEAGDDTTRTRARKRAVQEARER